MRTTTISVEKVIPLLQITRDESPQDPRENDNIWYIHIRNHRRYRFPEELAISWDEWEETIQELIALEKNFYVFSIDCYEHSSITFSISGTGTQCQFDTAKFVWVIAIPKSYNGYDIKEWNRSTNRDNPEAKEVIVTEEEANQIAIGEINEYNQYINGEVYQFVLFDNDGDTIDSCSGFHDINDIKDQLPKEWADESMEQYLVQ